MKAKFFICLISLFLFVAAADTIPGRPANTFANGYGGTILYPLIYVHRFTLPEGLIASGLSRRIQIVWFPSRQDFSNELVGVCPLALVHHATDSSTTPAKPRSLSSLKVPIFAVSFKNDLVAANCRHLAITKDLRSRESPDVEREYAIAS